MRPDVLFFLALAVVLAAIVAGLGHVFNDRRQGYIGAVGIVVLVVILISIKPGW